MKKKPKRKNKPGAGRPKKIVNYKTLDSLCRIHCTGEECANILGLKYETMDEAIQRDKGKNFREYFAEKSAGGKRSLRRKQWTKALAGDNTMLIWLGKQHLGQTDVQKIETEHTERLQLEVIHVEIAERLNFIDNDLQSLDIKAIPESIPERSQG